MVPEFSVFNKKISRHFLKVPVKRRTREQIAFETLKSARFHITVFHVIKMCIFEMFCFENFAMTFMWFLMLAV